MPNAENPELSTGQEVGEDRFPLGFELRFSEGRAFISAAGRPLGEGVVARQFAMEIPHVRFPFDVTGGAEKFRDQRCTLRDLEVAIDAELLQRWVLERLADPSLGLSGLELFPRFGFIELRGVQSVAGPFTAKLALMPEGREILLCVYDLRLYRPGPLCAAELLQRLAAEPARLGSPLLSAAGPSRLKVDLLGVVLQRLLAGRGFKIPDVRSVELRRVSIGQGQVVLGFGPPETPQNPLLPEQLTVLDGERSLAQVEALIGEGQQARARRELLAQPAEGAHPLAAERLLQLLACNPDERDLALDLCALYRQRVPPLTAALWVEGTLREAEGDRSAGATSLLALAEHALAAGELFSAAAAARAAAKLAESESPKTGEELVARAYSVWETAAPQDVEALSGLADAAERRGDLPGALSALRRLAAYGDGNEKAALAHARLGRLLLERTDDVVRARLHLDQALRHDPESRVTLLALSEACLRSGEPMRSIRLLDQAADLAQRDGELLEAVGLRIRSGQVWEDHLRRPENALLRYRDAADLARQTGLGQLELSAIALLASACQKLGLWTEALEAQRLLADRCPPGRPRAAAMLAQARLLAENVPDKEDADRACSRALREDPDFLEAALELCTLRRGGPAVRLLEALPRAAALSTDPVARAALLAEQGALALQELKDDGAALDVFIEALRFDADCQRALSGAAEIAERSGRFTDAADYLERLSKLEPHEARAATFVKLAALAERLGDPAAAAHALAHVAADPEAPLSVLLRLLSVQRRGKQWQESDELAMRASERAELEGETTVAAEILREQLEDVSDPVRATAALQLATRLDRLVPRNPFSCWTRVRLARMAKDAATLRDRLLELWSLLPAQATPEDHLPNPVDVQRELGEVSLALGRIADAASAYEEVCRMAPQDETAWTALGDLQGMLGHGAEEARSLEQLAELLIQRGERAAAAGRWRQAARLLRSLEPRAALEDLKRAAETSRDVAPELLAELADLAEELHESAVASVALARLAPSLATPRERARAHRRSALLAVDADAAFTSARLAAEADPEYLWGQIVGAVLALESGDAGRAHALAEMALSTNADVEALEPDPLSASEREVAAGLAWAAARAMGDAPAERVALERLCAKDPENRSLLLRRIELLRASPGGEPELLRALRELAPRLPDGEASQAFSELGERLASRDEPVLAEQAFFAALRHVENHPRALIGALRLLPFEVESRRELLARLLDRPESLSSLNVRAEELGRLWSEYAGRLETEGADSIRAWKAATEVDPEDQGAPERWAQALESAGRSAEAGRAHGELFGRKLRASSPQAWAAAVRAAELLQAAGSPGDLGEAQSILEKALGMDPPAAEAMRLSLQLGAMQRQAGQFVEEAQTLERVLPMVESERRADLHARRAEIFRHLGDREGERIALQHAVSSRPRDLGLLRQLGEAQLTLGDFEGAVDTLEQTAATLLPDRPAAAAAQLQRGRLAEEQLGHGSVAEAAYRRALALDPDQLEARRRLGELLLKRADADSITAGLGLLAEAMHRSGASPDGLAALARRAHLEFGNDEFALMLLRPLLGDEAAPEGALVLGAELLYLGGAMGEALALLRRLSPRPFSEEPDVRERLALYHAEVAAQLGEVEEGLIQLEHLLHESPQNRRALALHRELLRGAVPEAAAERLLALAPALEKSLAATATSSAAELLLETQPQRALQLFSDLGDRHGLRAALARVGDHAGLHAAIDQDLARARELGDFAAEAEALRSLAELHRARGDSAEEAQALERLVALLTSVGQEESEMLARSLLGELLERQGDGERALSVYLEALGRPAGSKLVAPAEILARRLGRWETLAELLGRKLELASSPEVKPHRADWALELAALCEGPVGDIDLAERTLRQALEEDPENLRVGEKLSQILERSERWRDLGELQLRRAHFAEREGRVAHAGELYGHAGTNLIKAGGPEARQEGLSALLQSLQFSRDPQRLLLVGDALYEAGERASAADYYREVCERSPPPYRALERVAESERERGDPRALGTFLASRAHEAESPVRWFLQAARAFARAGDAREQRRAARSAFDLDPQNDAALAAVITTDDFTDPARWVEILTRRAASVPNEKVVLLSKAGEVLLAVGRAEEAVALFAEANSTDRDDPLALAGWVDAIRASTVGGASDEVAVDRLTAALRGAPLSAAHTEAALRLGAVQLARLRFPEARWAYEVAIQASPLLKRSPGVLRSLDEVYGGMGLRDLQLQARIDLYRVLGRGEDLEAVVAMLHPSDPQASELLREAWELSAPPRDAELALQIAQALSVAERWKDLVDWILKLRQEPVSPPLDAPERVRLCLWAADVSAQRLLDRPTASVARRLAFDACGTEPALLREVEQVARQADPELWVEVLGALATHAGEAERPALLLERAKAADSLLPPPTALSAWEEVARQGPTAPGYLLALERRLRAALAEGRYTEAVDSLLAESEAAMEPHQRAALLQKAAQLREERLQDQEGAIELYRRAAAESADEKGFALLAEAYDRMGRPAEAAAALGVEITRREPGERKRERQRKLGLLLAGELDSPREALPHLIAALEGGEADAELLQALAKCARAADDPSLELSALSGLADEDPGHGRDLRRAELLRLMGRDAEAVECLSQLLRGDPTNAAAFADLTLLLERRKGWRELVEGLRQRAQALADLDTAAEHRAERGALLARRGDILSSDLDDAAGAEEAYRAALELAPDNEGARNGLRSIFEARGDTAATASLLHDEWYAIPANSRPISVGLRLGRLHCTLGEFEAARSVLEQVIHLAEQAGDAASLMDAQGLLVRSLLALGQAQDALNLLTAAERRWSADLLPEVWALMGRAKFSLGHFDESVELMRRALAMQPALREAIDGMVAAAKEGSPALMAEALRYQLAAAEEPIERAALWRSLADVQLSALGDRPAAEESLRAAVAIAPDEDGSFERLREILEADGRIEDLADVLKQRARGMNDEAGRARVLCELGDLLRTRLREAAAASEAYQRSLELLPRNPLATEGLAESFLALGRDDEAAPLFRHTLAGGGHLGEFFIHFRLGEIARRAGDGPQALEHFQRSVEQNPTFLPAGDALIAVAEELGAGEVSLTALRSRVSLLDSQEFVDLVAEAHLKIAELEKRSLRFEAALESLEQAARLRPRDRRALELLAAMYQNRSRWPEAVRVLELLADLTDGSSQSSALTAAGEIALDKLADMERAEALFERALAATPGQERATRRLAEIAAALDRPQKLAAIADSYQAALGRQVPPWMEELWVPLASAYERQDRLEDAYVVIGRAREKSPDDPAVLHRQAELARRLGRLGDESDVEESLILQFQHDRPLEAANRLRALARSVLHQLDDSARAESLLRRANELAPARPEDRRMLADLQRRHPEGRLDALEAYLELVREDPAHDLVLLRVLAATAESVDRPELAQTARGLALALEGTAVSSAPSLTPFEASSWSLGSLAAASSLEIAMQSLAPYLEPLFPAQLHRFGVGDGDRVHAGHAPELNQWIERVRESLGARPIDAYLAPGTRGVAVENTQPPSLIIGSEAPIALGQSGMQFLACQRLALIELGLTLPAKFSPRDVTTLATLVTLFISDDVTLLPAERRRLAQFLDALAQTCPELVRAGVAIHAEGAVRELSTFDPQAYTRSGAARAHRIALLVTGDLSSGLRVFDYLDGEVSPAAGRPWDLPQGRDLIAWAFSQEHLALRRAALGKPPLEVEG